MMKTFLEIPVRDDATEFHTFERGPAVVEALNKLGIAVRGKRVVDLGAGFGSLSIACLRAGAADVLAVDINEERLEALVSRGLAHGVSVRAMKANLLEPWAMVGDADLALLIGVVEYGGLWDEAAEVTELQRRILQAAFASLKPGGLLVFGSKNRLWPRFAISDVHTQLPLVNVLPRATADSLSLRLSGRRYRHHIHSPRRWRTLIASAGFTSVRTYVPYLSYQFPLDIVARASLGDIRRLRRMPMTAEQRDVSWGRAGAIKVGIMATAGAVGVQMGPSVLAVAQKPVQ